MRLFFMVMTFLLVVITLTRSLPLDHDDDDDDDEVEVEDGDHEEDDATTENEDEQEDEEDKDEESDKESERRPSTTPVPTIVTSTTPTPKGPFTLYHKETSKSYEVLTKGPCTHNLKFLPMTGKLDETMGECGCHQNVTMGTPNYVPLVYHYPSDKCYHIYRQGYCKNATDWLVYTGRNRVECVDNPCRNLNLDPEKVVWFDRKCVELGDECGYSENGHLTIMFKDFDVVPTCSELFQPGVGPPSIFQGHGEADGDADTEGIEGQNNIFGCPKGQRPINKVDCMVTDVVG